MAGVSVTRRPFAYRPGVTFLHRMPAGIKLAALIVLSVIMFISASALALSLLLIIAAAVSARIPPPDLLKGSKLLVILSLCVIMMKTFELGAPGITTPEMIVCNFYIPDMYFPNINAAGFIDGILAALRILTSFSAAALLFAVTTMRELRLSLAAVETRLKKIFGKKQSIAFFSLGITLMLGFIPRFFELWETANLACRARSCKKGPRRLFILIPLVTEQMMEAAADTALALEARALGH